MSKYLDTNGLLYVWSKVKGLLSGKVDKAEGKGLSANDFTTEEKQKLASLSHYTLPAADAAVGDVWNVEATGMNYAWDGEKWDALGEMFEIQAITNAEIDAITAG